jgi:hypothetical protein
MPIAVAHLTCVFIPTRRHGLFQLRRLVVADVPFLEGLGCEEPEASEYVVRVLNNQLVAPHPSLAELRQLPTGRMRQRRSITQAFLARVMLPSRAYCSSWGEGPGFSSREPRAYRAPGGSARAPA